MHANTWDRIEQLSPKLARIAIALSKNGLGEPEDIQQSLVLKLAEHQEVLDQTDSYATTFAAWRVRDDMRTERRWRNRIVPLNDQKIAVNEPEHMPQQLSQAAIYAEYKKNGRVHLGMTAANMGIGVRKLKSMVLG